MDYPELWAKEGDSLSRVFTFRSFVEAIGFVNKIVPLAEEMKHHPDIEIFSYKNVKVKLSTHEAGNRITGKDLELATRINKIFP